VFLGKDIQEAPSKGGGSKSLERSTRSHAPHGSVDGFQSTGFRFPRWSAGTRHLFFRREIVRPFPAAQLHEDNRAELVFPKHSSFFLKCNPSKKAAFFSGCNIDFVCPDTGESVYKVLQELSIQVVFPQDQSCCGKPVVSVGDVEATKKIAKRNIEAFEAADVDYIIAACPNCTVTLNVTYAEILQDDPEWSARAEKFAHKVREFSQFVAEEYETAGRLGQQKTDGRKVTLHDSCHMKRVLEIFEEPRKLLSTKGYELVEMKDSDKCCGMAGAFGMKFPELSLPILNQKIQNIKNSGAGIVAVACPACMTQIGGGLDKQAPDIKVKHIADILAGK
jgi:L-lactate dehydrogenase complex protein LldF